MTYTEQLTAAKRARSHAQNDCPHWDYDEPDGADYPCCYVMRKAEDRVRALRDKNPKRWNY